MKTSLMIVALCALVAASGCSWTHVRPVNDLTDDESPGVRYYRMKPYVMVTDQSAQLIYLPDFKRAYRVTWGSFISKAEQNLELEHGTYLKQGRSVQDSAALFGTLTDMLKGAGAQAIESAYPTYALPKVGGKLKGIYELVYDEKTGKVLEMREVTLAEREK